jgi:hypothetical protein
VPVYHGPAESNLVLALLYLTRVLGHLFNPRPIISGAKTLAVFKCNNGVTLIYAACLPLIKKINVFSAILRCGKYYHQFAQNHS